jgi:hypothetical protein
VTVMARVVGDRCMARTVIPNRSAHMVLSNGLHDGHAASTIVAVIFRFTRCTVPLPHPTSFATLRIP